MPREKTEGFGGDKPTAYIPNAVPSFKCTSAPTNYPLYSEDNRDYVFLTITYRQDPNIGMRTTCSLKDQFASTVQEIMTQLDTSCDYLLVPEFTVSSRIHYHAILKVKPKCMAKYYKMISYFKRLGFVSATKVVHLQNVNNYIHKDVELMMNILGCSLPLSGASAPLLLQKIYEVNGL